MGNSILWHFSVPKYNENELKQFGLLEWVSNRDLYTGRYKDPVIGAYVRCSQHTAQNSGKLTQGFLIALLRVSMYRLFKRDTSAYGQNDNFCVAETAQRAVSNLLGDFDKVLPASDVLSVALYNKTTGKFMVTAISNSEAFFKPELFFMALWPELCKLSTFVAQWDQFVIGYKNRDTNAMASAAILMADIAYYATTGQNPDIKVDDDILFIERTSSQLSNSRIMPTEYHGTFRTIFQDAQKKDSQTVSIPENEPFVGAYHFGHELSEMEKALVPEMPENEKASVLTRTICTAIQESTDRTRHVRNVLLYGPTGTGKSTMAKHIACGLGLPYVSLNCNADTTIMDLLVQCMPADKNAAEKGHIDASPANGIPSIDDMLYDPESAWEAMTGEHVDSIGYEKCMAKAYALATGVEKDITPGEYVSFLIAKGMESNQDGQFMYVESPLVKAVRNGWVVEIQEPTTIVQAGVLPGLNSLLDSPGSIFLPNGEVVHRHPDCVVIATTNLNYQGCRAVNQSFLRRFQFKAIVKNPEGYEQLARLKDMVGYKDDDYVTETNLESMLDVAKQIKDLCESLDLTEGDIGICEVADWVNAANMVDSIRNAAEWTIIPSATQDEDAIQQMKDIIQQKFID